MGYERKRGKLEQFNALLRGGPRDPFSEIIGDLAILPTIRYVLTLDTDTGLPRDAARKLIGTMAHPLNRPRFDPSTGRVVEGYAILQPRTPISLLSANRSRFAQLSAGEAGIDPYTREVSDVYQDLFAEGSYVGKGIYDVDAFRQATAGRFPENLILSHDLVESGYARSALVSDVELHEDHPASFAAEMSRRHRWIRGDWQIAGWLLPRVLGPANKRLPNTLTALGWWKIFDNLRRSLVPPALLLLLLGGWVLAPKPTGFWTLFVLLLLLLPVLLATLVEVVRKPRERAWAIHLETALKSLGRQLAEAGLQLTTLPYHAVINLDAILVSGGRMLFTRRGLLLWHTPGYARRNGRTTLADFLREMWVAPFVRRGRYRVARVDASRRTARQRADVCCCGCCHPASAGGSAGHSWPTSPSCPTRNRRFCAASPGKPGATSKCWSTRRKTGCRPTISRKCPTPVIASRTSPTNIGMALLANLAATRFRLPFRRPAARPHGQDPHHAWSELERYRGHLYNWYDTRTLKPLRPLYVSSVDSGNLAGALFTLRAGLWELKNQPVFSPRVLDGTAGYPGNDLVLGRRSAPGQAAGSAAVQSPDRVGVAPGTQPGCHRAARPAATRHSNGGRRLSSGSAMPRGMTCSSSFPIPSSSTMCRRCRSWPARPPAATAPPSASGRSTNSPSVAPSWR